MELETTAGLVQHHLQEIGGSVVKPACRQADEVLCIL